MANHQETDTLREPTPQPDTLRLIMHDGRFDSTQGVIIDGLFGLQARFEDGKVSLAVFSARRLSVVWERTPSETPNPTISDIGVVEPTQDTKSAGAIFDPETHASITIEDKYRITLDSLKKEAQINVAEFHIRRPPQVVGINNVYDNDDFMGKLTGRGNSRKLPTP